MIVENLAVALRNTILRSIHTPLGYKLSELDPDNANTTVTFNVPGTDLPTTTSHEVPDNSELLLVIRAEPKEPSSAGFDEWGTIDVTIAVRTMPKGVLASVRTAHAGGDEELIGSQGQWANSTFQEISTAVNSRLREWANDYLRSIKDPRWVANMSKHYDEQLPHDWRHRPGSA